MKRTLLIFGSLIAALLILFQIGQYGIMRGSIKIELIISVIAVVFFFIGLYINRQYKNKVGSDIQMAEPDLNKLEELEITNREYEVLKLVAEGLSNKEIGDRLFLSESTIKTHVSNLLVKLDARRRTQAIQKAKAQGIL